MSRYFNGAYILRASRAGFALMLAGVLLAGVPAWAAGKLTVTGEGTIPAAPDMATVMLGVTSQADTAGAALAENSSQVAAILARLTAAGIQARDIQTSGLSLNPQFDYAKSDSGQLPDILGYVVTNAVTVQVRDLPKLGTLLDQVVQGGANTLNGLTFGLSDPAPSLDAARKKAVADARRKAELYATAAGASLGQVLALTETSGYASPAPMFRMAADTASEAVPVASGELGITATVTIEYELTQ